MILWIALALAAAAVVGAYFLGRSHVQKKDAVAALKVKDEQLKIAADRPSGRDALADRVRDDL